MRSSTTGRLRSDATAITASSSGPNRRGSTMSSGTAGSLPVGARDRHLVSDAPAGGVRVFLVDDHEVVRRGVRQLLEDSGEIVVVGEAGTAAEALARIPPTRPDVALLDVRLPDGDGVEVCREVRSRHPEIQCLMLTSFSDDEALFQAIMAGASGDLRKQIKGPEM